jgi:hypothetical protein
MMKRKNRSDSEGNINLVQLLEALVDGDVTGTSICCTAVGIDSST